MRRKDREMDVEFAYMVVDKCEYAVLSMVDVDGGPYCVPVSIVRDGDAVYFHCARQGQKADAMRKNPKVCIACVGDTRPALNEFSTEYESAIVRGTVSEVTDDGDKINALRLLCERHTPSNMQEFDEEISRNLFRTAVWRVQVSSVTGKRKKYGPDGIELKTGSLE